MPGTNKLHLVGSDHKVTATSIDMRATLSAADTAVAVRGAVVSIAATTHDASHHS